MVVSKEATVLNQRDMWSVYQVCLQGVELLDSIFLCFYLQISYTGLSKVQLNFLRLLSEKLTQNITIKTSHRIQIDETRFRRLTWKNGIKEVDEETVFTDTVFQVSLKFIIFHLDELAQLIPFHFLFSYLLYLYLI